MTGVWNYWPSKPMQAIGEFRKKQVEHSEDCTAETRILKVEHKSPNDRQTTIFFDWIPDWEDLRDYKLTKFYNYLTAHKLITTLTDQDNKTDLSISAYLDTRKTDLVNQRDGAAREVAYAADIAYSSAEHVLIPLHVDYTLLYKKTINRMLNTESEDSKEGICYPVPIREVLKTLHRNGLANSISHWKFTFYNLEHSLDAVRISLMNGYPVVFGFVVSQDIFNVGQLKGCCSVGSLDDQPGLNNNPTSSLSTYGSLVGCIVGFSKNTFKIHVSDKRLFYQDSLPGSLSDPPGSLGSNAFHSFRPFLYLPEDYLQSNMCNDFYSMVGIHESPIFELLGNQDPTQSDQDQEQLY